VQNYGLRLIKDFPNNTVFLIGYENALMDSYFIPLTGSNNIVLCWPGEDWPKNALNKIVTRYLSEGKRIIVDPDKYDVCWILADSRNELRKLIALHKIKHVYGTIYELYD
jgi:hypothetical protein